MIIVKLTGGLGNQLFQYSAARSLGIKNATGFRLDLSEYADENSFRKYGLKHFNIVENIASAEEINAFRKTGLKKILEKLKPYYRRSVIKYRNYAFDKNVLDLSGDHYLNGYWQSEKYFKQIETAIRAEVTLKTPLDGAANELLKHIDSVHSVSIHVRRGDYLTNKISKVYELCDKEYYERALEKMLEKIPSAEFFIFSDDPAWVKANLPLPSSANVVSGNNLPEHEELFLMAACKHQIIANSSFSWWGAWLNNNPNKIIIGPKVWFKFSQDDQGIMPESWLKT
jgi:hypothetical protein